MNKLDLARIAAEVDGHWSINETSRIALRDNLPLRVDEERGALAAFAVATGDEPVELVVHPNHRRQGIATVLMSELIESGEHSFWAHGALPGAQALARKFNLTPARTLLVLTRPSETAPLTTTSDLRTFQAQDIAGIVAVNSRAFAKHREQGSMTVEDFMQRTQEPWFDPVGLFIAERDNKIIGFHWTKREGTVGEVYVIAVDPAAQGTGIGRELLIAGLQYLSDCERIDLYVEGDNTAAIALYEKFGFTERSRDINYILDSRIIS